MEYKCDHCNVTFEWAESVAEKVAHYCKDGEIGIAAMVE